LERRTARGGEAWARLGAEEPNNDEEQVRPRSMDLKSMWWFEWSTSSMKIKPKIHCPYQVVWWICRTTFSLRHQIYGIWICTRQRYEHRVFHFTSYKVCRED
jgi:hypothetical protein